MSYIYGDWNHVFSDIPGVTELRFVFDIDANKIVVAQIATNCSAEDKGKVWKSISEDQIKDLHDSIISGNEEIFDIPVDYGLELSDYLPAWASFC